MRKLSRLPAVLGRVPLGRSQLYTFIANGSFPQPIKIGPRAVAWDDDEIDAWIAARAAERVAA